MSVLTPEAEREFKVQVGEKYKVNAPSARSGLYEVREIRVNKKDQVEVTARHATDPHVRVFLEDQFVLDSETTKRGSQAKKIISTEIEVLADFDGVQMVLEEVSLWPNWGARGRPRKEK